MVAFENYPYDEAAAARGRLCASATSRPLDTTNYPLALRRILAGALHLDLDFDPRLFDPATSSRSPRRLHTLLTATTDHPDLPLRQLPWMSPQERQHILTHSKPPATRRPAARRPAALPRRRFVGLFEAQAAARPTPRSHLR